MKFLELLTKSRNRTKNKKKKGFTLIELIVVISILAVLSASAVVAYGNITTQAKTAADNANAASIVRALNTYNALAGSPFAPTVTGKLTKADADDLSALNLNAADDMITMAMGVQITETDLEDLLTRIAITANNDNVWSYAKIVAGGGGGDD